uniref:Uncharacterized protein n=1 Tax=Rhizophora mucronata TaxID=61149 RepID=A0A2P2NMJ2_RHIMU
MESHRKYKMAKEQRQPFRICWHHPFGRAEMEFVRIPKLKSPTSICNDNK